MTETITRERLNEMIDQFATAILEALEAAPTDEEGSPEPEPVAPDTTCLMFTADDKAEVLDVADLSSGALVIANYCEYFHCRLSSEGEWMSFSGDWYTEEDFAEKMRNETRQPRLVHWG